MIYDWNPRYPGRPPAGRRPDPDATAPALTAARSTGADVRRRPDLAGPAPRSAPAPRRPARSRLASAIARLPPDRPRDAPEASALAHAGEPGGAITAARSWRGAAGRDAAMPSARRARAVSRRRPPRRALTRRRGARAETRATPVTRDAGASRDSPRGRPSRGPNRVAAARRREAGPSTQPPRSRAISPLTAPRRALECPEVAQSGGKWGSSRPRVEPTGRPRGTEAQPLVDRSTRRHSTSGVSGSGVHR